MKSYFISLIGDNACQKAITAFCSALICLCGGVFLSMYAVTEKLSPNVSQVAHLSCSTVALEFANERLVIDG